MATDETARAWKSTRESKAGIFISDNKAVVAGDEKHFMAVDAGGVTFKGPTSNVSLSTERRSGGLFVGLGEFMDMIPSTIVTPIPTKIPLPPIQGLVNITQDVALFLALLI